MKTDRIVALVLAGGLSSRMGGGDKALLPIGGRSMLAAVIAALDVPGIAISANGDPARFAGFGLPVLPDGVFENEGPLAGLLAGLEWAAGLGADVLLTSPCDTPCLPRGLSEILRPAPCGVTSGGRQHHLIATWPVAVAPRLRALLAAPGFRGVGRFAAAIGMRYIAFEATQSDPFVNVNTPRDLSGLTNARTIVRDSRPAGT